MRSSGKRIFGLSRASKTVFHQFLLQHTASLLYQLHGGSKCYAEPNDNFWSLTDSYHAQCYWQKIDLVSRNRRQVCTESLQLKRHQGIWHKLHVYVFFSDWSKGKTENIVGSMDQEPSQQPQMWFSEHFFAPKLVWLFVTPIVSSTVEQIWREKVSEEPYSIRLLRWFNFSQSGSRENNTPLRKILTSF